MIYFEKSQLFTRFPELEECRREIQSSLELLIECFESNGKLLIMGNGGSSADAEHFCGELVKGFLLDRNLSQKQREAYDKLDPNLAKYLENGLPAISLGVAHSLISAYINDQNAEYMYAQQIHVHANSNDVVFGISTSGNSKNIVAGLKVAKANGVKTIALTGQSPSTCSEFAEITIKAPASETFIVQELHLPIYHALCIELEEYFFGKSNLNEY